MFFRRHPVLGPLSMTLTVTVLCGVIFAGAAHAVDWTGLIPNGDGIVNGANGRDDTTWIATLLVVLGAVVGMTILGGVAMVIRLMMAAFKDSLAAQRAADEKRFDAACKTFETECERQRADHKEQRREDREAFDSRTELMVQNLSDLPHRLSTAVVSALRTGGA